MEMKVEINDLLMEGIIHQVLKRKTSNTQKLIILYLVILLLMEPQGGLI